MFSTIDFRFDEYNPEDKSKFVWKQFLDYVQVNSKFWSSLSYET